MWIRHHISTVRFFILVKGSPAEFFNNSRGLRQRDSLSPFFFIIVMDALSRMINMAVDGSFMSGYLLGGGTLLVASMSHISFSFMIPLFLVILTKIAFDL